MKKLLFILFNLVLLGYMFFALGFSHSREKETLCTEVRISMMDTIHAGFLKKADIESMVLTEGSEILGYPIKGINTRELEQEIEKRAYVKNAEIYHNLSGVLNIDIVQRKPVIRVIAPSSNSYYMDRDGYIFPSAMGFTPHVLIASGYFTEGKEIRNIKRLKDLADKEEYAEWNDVLNLALFIQQDEFWKSQLVQIYRNREGDFELIPRVGAHQIIFGDAGDMEYKFKKLRTLYDEGLKYEGWNKYEKINLKYKNQVICTKR